METNVADEGLKVAHGTSSFLRRVSWIGFPAESRAEALQVIPEKANVAADDAKVRNQLLDEFNIEIAGGFGPIKGKIWRVGLMGYCSQKPNVLLFLAALEKCLIDQGFRVGSGAGVGAAIRSYSQVETATAVSR